MVLQTGDLVTIDQVDPTIAPKIPELLRLRQAIYSPEFRAMVQEMTGCRYARCPTNRNCRIVCSSRTSHLSPLHTTRLSPLCVPCLSLLFFLNLFSPPSPLSAHLSSLLFDVHIFTTFSPPL
jgi:hypothetical protein